MKSVDLALVCSLDSLIRTGVTGSYEEVAKKLNISLSTLYDLVRYLINEMRAPILYDDQAQSFFYEYKPKFFLSSEIKSGMLSGKGEPKNAYDNKLDGSDSDLDEKDEEDEMQDEMTEATELSEMSGGMDDDD